MIPHATTKITIKRAPADKTADSLRPDPTDVNKDMLSRYSDYRINLRACIRPPSIRGTGHLFFAAGQKERRSMHLVCDPVDLEYTDLVLDQSTGEVYEIDWVAQAQDLYSSPGARSAKVHDYTESMVTKVSGVGSGGGIGG